MNTRIARLLAGAALCGLTLLAVSCDALNPALINQTGVNVASQGTEPIGSILLVLNNQRGLTLGVNYTFETTRPGETITTSAGILYGPAGVWASSFDCNTSKVTIDGIVVGGTTSQPAGTADLPLTITYERPNLQCGSVIFVTVPLIGSPTVDLLP